jgi:paraquat-inducible protein B
MANTYAENKYFRIGAFILVGLALLIIGLLIFGSKQLLQPTIYVETYFDESIQGISEGTAVKYRGLQIGYVKEIAFASEIYNSHTNANIKLHNRSIYVKIAITSKLFTNLSPSQFNELLSREIASGLRIKLESQGITGISYLELNYTDPKNSPIMPISWTPKNFYIPSSPSIMTELGKNVQNILHEIKDVDFKKIFSNIETFTATANNVLHRTDSRLNRINEPLEITLWNLKFISDNLRIIADQMKFHPSQMVFGNPPPPIDPEKL